MFEKKISIIVPVYNVENYLSNCLDSILSQTHGNIELILIDDGSTDQSGNICDLYQKKDSRIQVIHQENAGVSAARNRGIVAASGAYIGFVDADDYIACDMYEHLLFLCEHYDAQIAQCAHVRTNSQNDWNWSAAGCETIRVLSCDKALHELLCSRSVRSSLCNKLYQRKLFDGTLLNCELTAGEDGIANYFLIHKTEKVVLSSKVCYFYYQRENSCTHGALNDKIYQSFRFVQSYGEKEINQQLKLSWKFNLAVKAINYLRRAAKEDNWEHFNEMRSFVVASKGVLLHPRKYVVMGDKYILLHIFLLCIFPGVYRKLLSRQIVES